MVKVVSFDVSGNYAEGKGTSGVCIMKDGDPVYLFEIKAKKFSCAEDYWKEHLNLIEQEDPDYVVLEGYRLYNHRGREAKLQANSTLETPQLIGVIRMFCYERGLPLYIQYAADVKTRWNEELLERSGYLEKRGKNYYFRNVLTSPHKRDALKHALHFWKYTFSRGKEN